MLWLNDSRLNDDDECFIMSRTTDRLSLTSSAITYHHTLNSPAKSISTNKDNTQCVVGGRYFIKVFNIEERRFVERHNLVGHKKLNYSITDVQWHPVEENIIASAAGNGAVIIWDLNKESKQDTLFQEHYRFVNRLCFHPVDPLLLSCSQDGHMHCFDVRARDLKMTFFSKNEYIRDVQFHPTDKHLFCAVSESGNVQLWDIRKHDSYASQFTAHIAPVFTLNWHPEERHWLSTGGRDDSIKIWDTSQPCTHPTHTIHTISAVHKIKWRPGHKYYIASCALVLDNNINIWDIRRPYVPYATFLEHTKAATGIIWQKENIILSCSEDLTIYHHAMEDADRPIANAPQVALGIAPNGLIGHAFPSSIAKPPQKNGLGSRLGSTVPQTSKQSSRKVEFKPETSTLNLHDGKDWLDECWIEKLAKNYKFYGKPFGELCEHNSTVASELNLAEKAQTWLILKQLYSSSNISQQNSLHMPLPSPMSSTSKHLLSNDRFLKKIESPESFRDFAGMDSSGSDDDSGLAHTGVLKPNHNEMAELDAVFGEDDYNNHFFPTEMGQDDEDFDRLPNEAFPLRQSFGEKNFLQGGDMTLEDTNENVKLPTFEVPMWEYKDIVKDMLYHYAEQGDLQMSVTVLLTLQDIGREMVELEVQKEWFLGYLEILSHLHLFNIATEIINHAPEQVNQENKGSTTVYMMCDHCMKKIEHGQPGWFCKHCNRICQVCSVCHIPVKGLYVWCQGCAHGGHLEHLKEWFEKREYCPTGCGHKCEFS